MDQLLSWLPHPDDEVIGCYHFMEQIGIRTPIDLVYVTEDQVSNMANLRRTESAESTSNQDAHGARPNLVELSGRGFG